MSEEHDPDALVGRLRDEAPSRRADEDICRVWGISWSNDEEGQFGGYNIMPKRVAYTRSLDAAVQLVALKAPGVDWAIQLDGDGYNASVGHAFADVPLIKGPALALIVALATYLALITTPPKDAREPPDDEAALRTPASERTSR